MKNLIVMRHAKAQPINPFISDRNRRLNKRGVHDAQKIGSKFLKKKSR